MKSLLVAALLVGSLNVLADHHGDHKEEMKKKWDSMSFEDLKKMKTEHLATKKANIEKAQSCVDQSKDKESLKACMKDMRGEMKSKMHQMKDKMKDKKKK